jgi:hypothetical protein
MYVVSETEYRNDEEIKHGKKETEMNTVEMSRVYWRSFENDLFWKWRRGHVS